MPDRLTTEQRAELRRLASEATAGPWMWTESNTTTKAEALEWLREHLSHGDDVPLSGVGVPEHPKTDLGDDPQRPEHMVEACVTGNGPNSSSNAQFIAASDPPTVLALLDEVDDARDEIVDLKDSNRARAKSMDWRKGEIHRLVSALSASEQRVAQLERELAQKGGTHAEAARSAMGKGGATKPTHRAAVDFADLRGGGAARDTPLAEVREALETSYPMLFNDWPTQAARVKAALSRLDAAMGKEGGDA